MRTKKDRTLDAVLLLHMLDRAKPIDGKTKLQKVPFFVELKLKNEGLRGPHFRFLRWHFGPFSRDVCDTFDLLAHKGFVSKSDFKLTERGKFLLELAIPPIAEIETNAPIFRVMDDVLRDCARKHGSTLKKIAYETLIATEDHPGRTVKEIPQATDLIEPEPGGIEVPEDLEALILEELNLTDDQLEAARKRLPEIESEMTDRLRSLMSAGQPS